MSCHPFLDRPVVRRKCVMPLGLSITTKANLLAGKYTLSYFLGPGFSLQILLCLRLVWGSGSVRDSGSTRGHTTIQPQCPHAPSRLLSSLHHHLRSILLLPTLPSILLYSNLPILHSICSKGSACHLLLGRSMSKRVTQFWQSIHGVIFPLFFLSWLVPQEVDGFRMLYVASC